MLGQKDRFSVDELHLEAVQSKVEQASAKLNEPPFSRRKLAFKIRLFRGKVSGERAATKSATSEIRSERRVETLG
jgi:hypothetical protein